MKQQIRIAAVALVCLMSALCAQAGFHFGIRAGLNVNEIHFNRSVYDADNRCGFTGGVMAEFEVPIIGLCFDASVMYTRMNSEVDREGVLNNENEEISVRNDYNVGKNFLEIPINLKYKFNIPVVASVFRPYVFTGPTFAFKLDKNTYEYMKTRTCQVAWNVGIGLEFIRHLQIGASYGFGINNIADNWVSAEKVKAKNNYWTVTAAWLF